ncbi:MAG: FAD-binding oxidoreductase, partial [Fimbriimonadaceae bacterium]
MALPQTQPEIVPLERLRRLSGFGMSSAADAYVFRPSNVEEIRECFRLALRAERKVVLRGNGLSYGDANYAPEAIALDLSRMNRILDWNRESGEIVVEPGVTLEQIWRHTLEDGYWPPVVSGTMRPTLGGALAMNVHGKNAFKAGPIGEFVQEFDLLTPSGEVETVHKGDELYHHLVGTAGTLGVFTRIVLKLKRLNSARLNVLELSAHTLADHFRAFNEQEPKADYMVSWVDCFAKGRSLGRGIFHTAKYSASSSDSQGSFHADRQDLPASVLGFLPKSMVWRFLRPFNNRTGMRFINRAKHHAAKVLGHGKNASQSLVEFSFLLDYVPDWRNAYSPNGFIQYQSFVPKARAEEVFARQIARQQKEKLESFLGVMKRHREDEFLLSHGVDGFSLALDFKVTPRNRERLFAMCRDFNEEVLAAGGKFYLAKDSTLTPDQFA